MIKERPQQKKLSLVLIEVICLLASFTVLVPLYFVLITSFKSKNEAADMLLTFPTQFHIIDNYKTVIFKGNIFNAFLNSALITISSVILIVIFSAFAGFVLQRRVGKASTFINFLIMIGLIVPPSMVTTFWVMKFLHMSGSYLGVILMYIAIGFPFSTILFKGFYKTIPVELDQAAFIDGCSSLRMFFSIIFPLLKPVTVTVFIVQFMTVWNDFTIVLYFLTSSSQYTLPLTIYFFFGQFASSWNLVFADVVIIAAPVIAIYIFAQKYIIAGMTSGAVKG